MAWQVITGDCIAAMQAMDAASVDAIVTDPPYGLEFMGKEWDRFVGKIPGRGARVATERAAEMTVAGAHQGSKGPYLAARVDQYVAGTPYQDWSREWATEALRVLKPGAHLLAFGGTRTFHRLTCALEDAGFEIRDCLSWLYGSGFPKSLDVSKAIDKAAGAEREVVGVERSPFRMADPKIGNVYESTQSGDSRAVDAEGYIIRERTAPATEAAQRWQGWGTALKPAWEPIVMARKPLVGSVAANVQRYGTGAINVDAARIGTDGGTTRGDTSQNRLSPQGAFTTGHDIQPIDGGRWPANAVLDPEAAEMLDEQTGELGRSEGATRGQWGRHGIYGGAKGYDELQPVGYGDTGGASRFFAQFSHEEGTDGATLDDGEPGTADAGDPSLGARDTELRFRYVPKADREERNRGLEHMPLGPPPGSKRSAPAEGRESALGAPRQNHHPTVKPVALMQWLVRMVTPPGGTVLDPFTGSGSTGIAALREGFAFVGIEREAEYVEIARDRIIGDAPLFNVGSEVGA